MRTRRSDPSRPGWTRIRSGRGFRYLDEHGSPIPSEARDRIDALAIPPAWTEVWICPDDRGHIQAVGRDEAGRRQYLYHDAWRAKQNQVKFDRMLDLAATLSSARRLVTRDMRAEPGSRARALGAAFRLLDAAYLRIGSERFAHDHGSVGLTTLLGKHAHVSGDRVTLDFPGKSGVEWASHVDDADLAEVLRGLKKRGPSAHLLAWRDGDTWRALSAAEVNDYVRLRAGDEFSSKDFRTLHGTIVAARALAGTDAKATTTKTARQRAIAEAVRQASDTLGNTPAVARSSYVDPRVFDRFTAGDTIDTSGAPERALRRLVLGDD